MLEKFKSVTFAPLPERVACVEPDRGHKELDLDDPALSVMTDHRIEKAHRCLGDKSINRAMRQMAKENTNMLLVTDADGTVEGLITATDLSGEKPVQYTQQSGKKRDDIKVRHLMTPVNSIPSLTIHDVLESRIGDVLKTLDEIGSEFVLVSMMDNGTPAIRGVFSARNIAKALHIFFDPSPGARTFAEFTKALHGATWVH